MVCSSASLLQAATLTLLLVSQARANAAQYALDSSQSSVAFEVRTLGTAQRGTVARATGTVSVDASRSIGSLDVRLDARTLDAKSAVVRRLLRGENLLNVDEFPEISYRAQRVQLVNGALRTVPGDLTLRGVTRSVPLTVTAGDCSSADAGREPCRLTAIATFLRSDFGMTKYLGFASDEVKLVVTAVALPVVTPQDLAVPFAPQRQRLNVRYNAASVCDTRQSPTRTMRSRS